MMETTRFELRFHAFDCSLTFAFPCDANGRVDMDQLCDRSRANYLYARAMVGYELAPPAVWPSRMH